MRIALVSDWFLPRTGGLEFVIRDLASQLTLRGHEVEIITGTPGDSIVHGIKVHRVEVGPVVRRLFFRGQESHELQQRDIWRLLRQWKVSWNDWLLEPVERILGEGRFDVIHGHSAYSPLALTACRMAQKNNTPSVLTEHSISKGLGNVLLKTADRIWNWSVWPDIIAGVSTYVANELRAITGRTVEVLPNGIDPKDWAPRLKEFPPRIVSVMRLTPRKRGIDIVRSIPYISRKLSWKTPPRFTLVGDGPERSRIEQEAAYLGVTEQLEMCGELDRIQVRDVLAQSTVFVLPTLKEALSVSVLEALSVGVPIVAMDHGGVGDIVQHGREGFLAKDHRDFCDYIVQILSNPEMRSEMAAHTRESAARFDWDVVIKKHIDTYERAKVLRESVVTAC